MRTQSVEVLNESDRTQRIIDWVLFKNENTWPYVEGEWNPGDPIWPRPRRTAWGDYLYGNHIRPMVAVLEEGVFHVDQPVYWDDLPHHCHQCDVGWDDASTTCWVCGAEGVADTFESLSFFDIDYNEFCWGVDDSTIRLWENMNPPRREEVHSAVEDVNVVDWMQREMSRMLRTEVLYIPRGGNIEEYTPPEPPSASVYGAHYTWLVLDEASDGPFMDVETAFGVPENRAITDQIVFPEGWEEHLRPSIPVPDGPIRHVWGCFSEQIYPSSRPVWSRRMDG